jgi:4-amino-4-deoxy-L-arabinose transferase-like glycosyltransferase
MTAVTLSRPMHWTATRRLIGGSVFLLLLCWFLFCYRVAERDLSSSHEARAAQNAASILQQGDWGLPRLLNGQIELQKPPLYYWLVALLAQLRGGTVDGWAVRMPAALSALACVLALYSWGCCRGRPLAGFLAASILATCVHFTWLGRVGRVDMPLTLTVSLALLGFFLGARRQKEEPDRIAWPWFLVGYLAISAGVMLKGPIAVVLPAMTIIAFRLVERLCSVRSLAAPRVPQQAHRGSTLWWGVPLILALAAPWFIWANVRTHNQLFQVFFWYHNVERGLGGSDILQAHPWWFYGPRFFVDLLPWSVVCPLAAWLFIKRGWWRTDPEARFGLVWLLTMFGFLSLMRFKRADYLLPAYPGAALWLGGVLERFVGQTFLSATGETAGKNVCPTRTFTLRQLSCAVGLVLAGCVVGWTIYLSWIEPRHERERCYGRFAAEIRRRTADQVIFFRTEAHELVFQVGRPLDTILEWENLDVWASQPAIYVVMPPDCARDWRQHLRKGRLVEVLRTADLSNQTRERPLVLLRSVASPDAKETY